MIAVISELKSIQFETTGNGNRNLLKIKRKVRDWLHAPKSIFPFETEYFQNINYIIHDLHLKAASSYLQDWHEWLRFTFDKLAMDLSIIFFNFFRPYGKANLKSLFTGKSSCWQEMVHLKCSWVPPVTSNQWHVGVEHTKKLILSWVASYMSQSHYIHKSPAMSSFYETEY